MKDFKVFSMYLSEKTEVLRGHTDKYPWVPWNLWRLKMTLGDYLSR